MFIGLRRWFWEPVKPVKTLATNLSLIPKPTWYKKSKGSSGCLLTFIGRGMHVPSKISTGCFIFNNKERMLKHYLFDLQYSSKNPGIMACIYNPRDREVKTGGPVGFTSHSA